MISEWPDEWDKDNNNWLIFWTLSHLSCEQRTVIGPLGGTGARAAEHVEEEPKHACAPVPTHLQPMAALNVKEISPNLRAVAPTNAGVRNHCLTWLSQNFLKWLAAIGNTCRNNFENCCRMAVARFRKGCRATYKVDFERFQSPLSWKRTLLLLLLKLWQEKKLKHWAGMKFKKT